MLELNQLFFACNSLFFLSLLHSLSLHLFLSLCLYFCRCFFFFFGRANVNNNYTQFASKIEKFTAHNEMPCEILCKSYKSQNGFPCYRCAYCHSKILHPIFLVTSAWNETTHIETCTHVLVVMKNRYPDSAVHFKNSTITKLNSQASEMRFWINEFGYFSHIPYAM